MENSRAAREVNESIRSRMMMDVIRARESNENIRDRIDACEARIRDYLLNPTSLESILSQLDAFDTEVLEGHWGGYYEFYRRPLIRRLDELRSLVGQVAPERSDDVWTRPAPNIADPFRPESWGQAHQSRCPRQDRNVVLCATGEFSSSTCSICLGKFEKNEEQGFATCGHQFHARCIGLWALENREGNVPCPLCGRNLLMPQTPIRELPEQKSDLIGDGHPNSVAQATPTEAAGPPSLLNALRARFMKQVKSHFRKK